MPNSTKEDGFRIERAQGGGAGQGTFEEIAVLEAGSRSYNDMAIQNGQRYTYRVKSFNSDSSSSPSPLASATVNNLNPPGSESKQVNIHWGLYGLGITSILLTSIGWFMLEQRMSLLRKRSDYVESQYRDMRRLHEYYYDKSRY